MKRALANRKGVFEAGLGFLLKALLFVVIIGASVYVFNNVALADVKAQQAARGLGVAFNTIGLTTKDVRLEINCPSDARFTIEGDNITAVIDSFMGKGYAEYYYIHESNAILPPKTELDCHEGLIAISKHTDPLTAKTTISILR